MAGGAAAMAPGGEVAETLWALIDTVFPALEAPARQARKAGDAKLAAFLELDARTVGASTAAEARPACCVAWDSWPPRAGGPGWSSGGAGWSVIKLMGGRVDRSCPRAMTLACSCAQVLTGVSYLTPETQFQLGLCAPALPGAADSPASPPPPISCLPNPSCTLTGVACKVYAAQSGPCA